MFYRAQQMVEARWCQIGDSMKTKAIVVVALLLLFGLASPVQAQLYEYRPPGLTARDQIVDAFASGELGVHGAVEAYAIAANSTRPIQIWTWNYLLDGSWLTDYQGTVGWWTVITVGSGGGLPGIVIDSNGSPIPPASMSSFYGYYIRENGQWIAIPIQPPIP
jgi:hypothetical protein